MTEAVEVSLILPVYNEEKTIREIISASQETLKDIPSEIIVVDDGSTDATVEEVRKTSARLICHEKNRGKGVTLKTGFKAAKGNIIVVMDADGQDDPREIPKLLEAQKEFDADFVNGSRFIGTLERGAISKMNRLGTFFVDFFLNKILGIKITDSQAGFRCFKADKIRELDLQSEWYDIETETVIEAHRHNFKVVEIPVVRDKREFGQSHHNQVKFAIRFFKLLFRIYLKKKT